MMLPPERPDRIQIAFDYHRLVANAGLLLPVTLAHHLGLGELVDRHVDLGGAPGRANAGDKMMTLVASALAGGDCIDDADVLRTGGTASAIGCAVKAPSTLGTFLVWYVGMRQTDPTWVEENRGPAWSSHPILIEPEQLPGPIAPASCKEGPTFTQEVPMEGEPRFVGIDVSKAQVDVAVRPTGQRWVVSYDETGIKELVSQMVDLGPAMVLLEATGGLELPLVAALAAAALPVVVVNPRQVRDFARATGTLAKTDALDAAVLALLVQKVGVLYT